MASPNTLKLRNSFLVEIQVPHQRNKLIPQSKCCFKTEAHLYSPETKPLSKRDQWRAEVAERNNHERPRHNQSDC